MVLKGQRKSNGDDLTVAYILVSNKTGSRTILCDLCFKPLSFHHFIQSIAIKDIYDTKDTGNTLLQSIDNTLQFVDNYPLTNNIKENILNMLDRYNSFTLR